MASPSYRVNSPTVAAETVDGEVLMINLESGSYYSLRDTGAAIWDGIERGAATQTIAAICDITRIGLGPSALSII